MKVGIITFHYYYNYGTMLQAYALQEAVERLGCEAELINYRKPPLKTSFSTRLKRLPIYVFEIQRIITFNRYASRLAQKRKAFEVFANDYFKQTQTIYRKIEDFDGIEGQYDLFMTGSDQTFSPKVGNGLNPCILLDFVKDENKKVCYAPSVGYLKFTEEQREQFAKYINSYKHLSCREASGAEIIKSVTDKEVETVLDPTFLLSKDDWSAIAFEPKFTEPYIFCYFLGHRSHYNAAVEYLAQKTGYKVVYIPIDYHDMTTKKQLLFDCGPKEWLSLIKNAAIVCTDSFHGMCFSINFQKNFYVFNKCKGGINSGDNSRIYDLLNRLDLLDRFVDVDTKVEYSHVDYDKTNRLLDAEREKSKAYLNKILR